MRQSEFSANHVIGNNLKEKMAGSNNDNDTEMKTKETKQTICNPRKRMLMIALSLVGVLSVAAIVVYFSVDAATKQSKQVVNTPQP
ncbi:unnamed protein product, partial [Candidula unifasciata]